MGQPVAGPLASDLSHVLEESDGHLPMGYSLTLSLSRALCHCSLPELRKLEAEAGTGNQGSYFG